MALMLHLLIWAGTLPGVSADADVKVFVQTQRIVACEGQGGLIRVFDLDQKPQGELTLPNVPAYVCEAAGYLVFNYVDKQAVFNLVLVRPDLSGSRTAKGISLYYPNSYRGQLLAYDYDHFARQGSGYPPLARAFNITHLRYESLQVFKMPFELSKLRWNPGAFWMFERDNGLLVICERSAVMYMLNRGYLATERVTAQGAQASPERIPLKLPGGFQNPGPFQMPHVMTTTEARARFRDWGLGKTIIMLAWEADEGKIYLAFGAVKDGIFQVGVLKDGFDLQPLGSFTGKIAAAKGPALWRVERTSNGVVVRKEGF